MKIMSIVGARPQFIKLAPLCQQLKDDKDIEHIIVHTGQHYDFNMSKTFFDELGLPDPDFHLGVGSGPHAKQTGQIMQKCEQILLENRPDWLLVFGDTNSTLGGALAGVKLHIPIAHIEAGLRSYNKRMPEEVNRLLTDHSSDLLFCPTANAVENLKKEGFTNVVNNGQLLDWPAAQSINIKTRPLVLNVGDIMYDSFLLCMEIAERASRILDELKLTPQGYFLATVHRAENTDDPERLSRIIDILKEISNQKPVIFPIHPRTQKNLDVFHLNQINDMAPGLHFIDPVSYYNMLILEKNAFMLLTDSGGMQKEAYFLRLPCITLRDETEWIETAKGGWNTLTGVDKSKILEKINLIASHNVEFSAGEQAFGSGQTAQIIKNILKL